MASLLHTRKFDPAAAEMLEEPTIRVPYELMRRNHRAAQRQIEKDFAFLQNTIKSAKESSSLDPATLLSTLETCATRSTTLKRKFEAIQPSTSNPSVIRSRLPILEDIKTLSPSSSSSTTTSESTSNTEQTYQQFTTTRLSRYITEYLLRTSRPLTAQAYAQERGVLGEVDVALFVECERVERALRVGKSCAEALAWCGENRGTLKKTKNDLEFTLRLQEYVELCRARRSEQALTYARKFLTPWVETQMDMVQRAVALLAFGEGCEVPAYKALYEPSRWDDLAKVFRQTFNEVYGIPSNPLLSLTMAAGISSLKLAACLPNAPHLNDALTAGPTPAPNQSSAVVLPIPSLAATPPIHLLSTESDPSVSRRSDPTPLHTRPSHPQRNIDCPTCSSDLAVLAKGLPFSHHTNSKLVCRISGQVMDDENPPLAFPNGYVYSRNALQHMSGDNPKAIVTCPRTGATCQYSKLRKVYVS